MSLRLLVILGTAAVALAAPAPIVSAATPKKQQAGSPFPFTKIIAFGDDFSDNGSGSFAHGITGDPQTGAGKNLWGAGTWTDGLVPVSYLANSLALPLDYDYAFGSQGGGAVIGSVCNNTAVPPNERNAYAKLLSGDPIPDALGQITNYTSSGVFNSKIKKTLHVFWTGNNDMIASLGWLGRFTICDQDTLCHPAQQVFIKKLINCMTTSIVNLINGGAQHILVPNVYPRNLSPWMSQYISNQTGMINDFGGVISQTNTLLQSAIAGINTKYPTAKVMYYDVNAFLTAGLSDPSLVGGATYNYTCVDGCSQDVPGGNWNIFWNNTVVKHQPDNFFWMTTVMPSTTVLKAVAGDMLKFLSTQYPTGS